MTTTISGHIKHGFLAQVYLPWVEWEGTEWGDQIRPLHEAYACGTDYALTNEQLDQIEAILRDQIIGLKEWVDEMEYLGYGKNVIAAQNAYKETREYWENRAKELHDTISMEAAESLLPDWMKS